MRFGNPQSSPVIKTHGDRLMHQRFPRGQLHTKTRRYAHLFCCSFGIQAVGYLFATLWLGRFEFLGTDCLRHMRQHTGSHHAATGDVDELVTIQVLNYKSSPNAGFTVSQMGHPVHFRQTTLACRPAQFKPVDNRACIPQRTGSMM